MHKHAAAQQTCHQCLLTMLKHAEEYIIYTRKHIKNGIHLQEKSPRKWHFCLLSHCVCVCVCVCVCLLSFKSIFQRFQNTVDSRYLEFQGTLWNTSRYPYLDIPDLQNLGKNNSNNHIWQIYKYAVGLLKLEIYWKYCGKEEKLLLRSNFSSFPQYSYLLLDVHIYQIFTSR